MRDVIVAVLVFVGVSVGVCYTLHETFTALRRRKRIGAVIDAYESSARALQAAKDRQAPTYRHLDEWLATFNDKESENLIWAVRKSHALLLSFVKSESCTRAQTDTFLANVEETTRIINAWLKSHAANTPAIKE